MKILNKKMALPVWKLIYLLVVVVLPSIGVALLVILSSFLGGEIIGETLFWLILFLSVPIQIIFLVTFYLLIKKQAIDDEFRKRQIIFFLCMVLIFAFILAVSITLVEIFSAMFATIDVGSMEEAAQSSMISLEGLSISPDFFWIYSVLNLALLSLFAGFFIGMLFIDKIRAEGLLKILIYTFGSIIGGIILLLIATAVFMILQWILFALFGPAI